VHETPRKRLTRRSLTHQPARLPHHEMILDYLKEPCKNLCRRRPV
jgi:hypothetical protein